MRLVCTCTYSDTTDPSCPVHARTIPASTNRIEAAGTVRDAVRIQELEEAIAKVAGDYKIVVDGFGNQYAQVSAEAMVALEAALAKVSYANP